jgi:hypothetical protein
VPRRGSLRSCNGLLAVVGLGGEMIRGESQETDQHDLPTQDQRLHATIGKIASAGWFQVRCSVPKVCKGYRSAAACPRRVGDTSLAATMIWSVFAVEQVCSSGCKASVSKSGLVRLFPAFWRNRNRNRLQLLPVSTQLKPNRKGPVPIGCVIGCNRSQPVVVRIGCLS